MNEEQNDISIVGKNYIFTPDITVCAPKYAYIQIIFSEGNFAI